MNFVEKEDPHRIIDWGHDKKNRKAWAEIQALYKWWTKIRPKRKSPFDDKRLKDFKLKTRPIKGQPAAEIIWPDRKKYAKVYKAMDKDFELEEKWCREDTKYLHRLVNIRSYLWT